MTTPGPGEQPSAGARPKTRPKQALIRPDQQNGLDELARSLHDARSVKGERITANTLLRVAIDGLIEHEDRLYGDNEVQLLASWREFLALSASIGPLEAVLSDMVSEFSAGERDQISTGALVRIAVTGLAEQRRALHGANESELLVSWMAFLGEREAVAGR